MIVVNKVMFLLFLLFFTQSKERVCSKNEAGARGGMKGGKLSVVSKNSSPFREGRSSGVEHYSRGPTSDASVDGRVEHTSLQVLVFNCFFFHTPSKHKGRLCLCILPKRKKSHRVGFSFDLSHCLSFFGSQTSSKENVDDVCSVVSSFLELATHPYIHQ